MVNSCETPINAVIENKPKRLTGLDQKVRGQAGVLRTHPTRMSRHRRRGVTYLPMTIAHAERGNPVVFPKPLALGREAARQPDNAAGKGCGSKRRPSGNRADRGCAGR